MTRRVTVDFSDEVHGALERIADERGATLEAVLRDAVTLVQFVHTLRQDGGRLIADRVDGDTQEVLSP